MPIFRRGQDLSFFCSYLGRLKKKFHCELYAFCLMSNHFHLLLRGGEKVVCDLMHRLMTVYAMYFNSEYDHRGHVFEDRNWQKACLDDRYFMALLRYIHRNPVAAGLVTKPSDWKYSGHRELLGQAGQGLVDASFPLECFDSDPATARLAYLELLGETAVQSLAMATIESLCAQNGVMPEELLGKGNRRNADLRRQVIRSAAENGATTEQIMAALDCSHSTVSRALAEPVSISPAYLLPSTNRLGGAQPFQIA